MNRSGDNKHQVLSIPLRLGGFQGHLISHWQPREGCTKKGCKETAFVLELEISGPVVMSREVMASEGTSLMQQEHVLSLHVLDDGLKGCNSDMKKMVSLLEGRRS